MRTEERLVQVEAENAALQERDRLRQELLAQVQLLTGQLGTLVAQLEARVRELEAQRAKDSHNSSKPPSSDGLARKTKSLRCQSGRKPGGQLGHRGQTLRLVAEPDDLVEHRPAVCTACQIPLPVEAAVVGRVRSQVQDLTPLRPQITEHRALQVRCPACQTVSVGAMKAATDQARQQGLAHLDPAARTAYIAHYDALVAAGLDANPPPARGPRRRGRHKQTPARNFLERLPLGKEQVLAFLDDLTIPFDNNQAERDLRMLKVQQKVSGCFRADTRSAAFARIWGYCSTLSKQRIPLLAALASLFAGQPHYPHLA